jgi:hypothetical protein
MADLDRGERDFFDDYPLASELLILCYQPGRKIFQIEALDQTVGTK